MIDGRLKRAYQVKDVWANGYVPIIVKGVQDFKFRVWSAPKSIAKKAMKGLGNVA